MLKLENENIKVLISINPFEIKSIKFKDREILYQQNNKWNKTWPILFPVCGNLKANLTVNGKELELKRHGFFNEFLDWKIIKSKKSKLILEFISNDKFLNNFPYNFKFIIYLELNKNNFNFKIILENIDNKNLFFSIGHHPGFLVDKNTKIILNNEQKYSFEFQSGLLPKKTNSFLEIKNFKKSELSFSKSDSYLAIENICNSAIIKNKHIEYELFFNDYKSLILWSESNESDFLCIEPWNGLPDYFDKTSFELKDKEGILELESNAKKEFDFKINFIK